MRNNEGRRKSLARCLIVAPETFFLSLLRLGFHFIIARSLTLALISSEIIFVVAHICQMPRKMWNWRRKNSWKWIAFRFSPVYFPPLTSIRSSKPTFFYIIRSVSFFFDSAIVSRLVSSIPYFRTHTHSIEHSHIFFWISFNKTRTIA